MHHRDEAGSLNIEYQQSVKLLRHAKNRLPAERSRLSLNDDVEISALEARTRRLRDRMRQLSRAD